MVNDVAEIDDEIDEDVRRLHAEAEKQIAELKEKATVEPVDVPEKMPETPKATVPVSKPKIRTFDQWFYGEGMQKELQAISKRRGNLVGLMTAYSNLDILRSLKEIPDLIQDVVDSIDALSKKMDELTKAPEIVIDKTPSSPGATRKRGGANG